MDGPVGEAPVVPLPERIDRPMRLGPFPSSWDAIKFLAYAGGGAVLAPVLSPLAWLPFLGVGLLVALWRPDGVAIDEQAVAILRWWFVRSGVRGVTGSASDLGPAGPEVRLPSGSQAIVLRASGSPLAYRPPEELASLFDTYREFLRSVGPSVVILSGTGPLTPPTVPSAAPGDPGEEQRARRGYCDLVRALGRRRRRRWIDLALRAEGSADEAAALRRSVERWQEGLASLGLSGAPLRDRPLRMALGALGWGQGPREP